MQELRIEPRKLMEYTLQEIEYLSEGILWNLNAKSEEGQKQNRLRGQQLQAGEKLEKEKVKSMRFYVREKYCKQEKNKYTFTQSKVTYYEYINLCFISSKKNKMYSTIYQLVQWLNLSTLNKPRIRYTIIAIANCLCLLLARMI